MGVVGGPPAAGPGGDSTGFRGGREALHLRIKKRCGASHLLEVFWLAARVSKGLLS